MRFTARLSLDGKTATGIAVPPEVMAALGPGSRHPVRVTIGSHTYLSTTAMMSGVAKLPVSAAVRAAAGVSAGDDIEVVVERDDTPRTAEVPADLDAALSADVEARAFFDALSYSRRRAYVDWVESAKKPETRTQRVMRTAELLAERRPQR